MPYQIYHLSEGKDQQARVTLFSPEGAQGEIYLHGAHVTSWRTTHGEEQLFLSPRSKFGSETAIRGGIPVIFPQFSGEGSLPKHGFARTQQWEFVEAWEAEGGVKARFRARDNEMTRSIWPYTFMNEIEVWLSSEQLRVTLSVTNTDPQPFGFTAALHSYFKVNDIQHVRLLGLQGLPYLDTVGERTQRVQAESELKFEGEVDRIYYNATRPLNLREGERQLTVEMNGFQDAVIWNPWAELAAKLPDMEPEGYRKMVCVEAVRVGSPVVLQPGQRWSGTQTIHASGSPDGYR
jgi:glucose-6-phosphate 1-epimerase